VKRPMLIACLIVITHAAAGRAQSTVYVGGDVFLDVQRGSGATSPRETRVDTNVGGGGVRVGTFLANRWSLEIGVDGSAAAEATLSLTPEASVGPASTASGVIAFVDGPSIQVPSLVVVSFEERIRTRVTTTAMLLGYHPPPRGRLTAGFKGGVSFVRRNSTVTSTTTYTLTDPRLAPLITLPRPSSTTSSGVTFSTAATLSAELGVALTRHIAVVPEARAFGFDGTIFLRPAVQARWLF
jgi:hypothetical protein